MKKMILIMTVVIGLWLFCDTVRAADDQDALLQQQASLTGADGLYASLPEETREWLTEAGIQSVDPRQLSAVDSAAILQRLLQGSGERTPFGAVAACMGMILLCAAADSMKLTFGDRSLSVVTGSVGAVCICTAAVIPLSGLMERGTGVIRCAAGFMDVYVPVMAGLLAGTGHEASAAAYYSTLMTAGAVIGQLVSVWILPLMNVFLMLSVSAGISPRLNLRSVTEVLFRSAKWLLGFSMSIFVTILSAQTLAASSLDHVSKRALRFAVGSFVPVVGNVLGETISAFSGSLELLRSGAGVFVIMASGVMFLPVLAECVLWQLSLLVLSVSAEIAGLEKIKGVLKALSTVVSMLMAALVCILVVFILSTVIILLIVK